MDCRRARARGALILTLAAAACGGEPPVPLTAGAAVPAEWRARDAAGRPAVIWIFRTEDCLSCQALDYSLRRLQRARAGEVALVAVHVGHAEHAEIPRAFFANRRLRLDGAAEMTPRGFRRRYGEPVLPMLLLARGGTILWSSAGAGQPRLTVERVDSIFGAHLSDGGWKEEGKAGGSDQSR